jgi:Ca-activated chloride channel homolog
MSKRLASVALCGILLLSYSKTASQGQAIFTTKIELVHVPVTVLDPEGRFVPGIGREDFEVYEDDVRQPLQVFTAGAIPVSVGVLLDGSNSMKGGRIADALEALSQLVQYGLAPGDDVFVMEFAGVPRLVHGWTEKTTLEGATLHVRIGGGTPMYETLTRAVAELSGARHVRRVLLLITDGNATDGWLQPRATANWPYKARVALQRSEALLYAVGIDSPPADRINPEMAKPVDAATLQRFTDATGGYTEIVKSSADLVQAVRRISDELKQQYLLGYESNKAHDGRLHAIRVEVRRSGCRVRARRVFLATEHGK